MSANSRIENHYAKGHQCKISYRQQLNHFQKEGQQKTKNKKAERNHSNITKQNLWINPLFPHKNKKENEIDERNMYRNNKVAAKAKIISRRADRVMQHLTGYPGADVGPIYLYIYIYIYIYQKLRPAKGGPTKILDRWLCDKPKKGRK